MVPLNFGALTSPQDRVAVVATEPLTTDEAWMACEPGRVYTFEDGDVTA